MVKTTENLSRSLSAAMDTIASLVARCSMLEELYRTEHTKATEYERVLEADGYDPKSWEWR